MTGNLRNRNNLFTGIPGGMPVIFENPFFEFKSFQENFGDFRRFRFDSKLFR